MGFRPQRKLQRPKALCLRGECYNSFWLGGGGLGYFGSLGYFGVRLWGSRDCDPMLAAKGLLTRVTQNSIALQFNGARAFRDPLRHGSPNCNY